MKKFISLLICLILLNSFIISANAINVDLIQPDTNIFFIGITNTETPVTNGLQTYHNNGNTIIIIPQDKIYGTYNNPITGRPIETQTTTEQPKEEPNITVPESDNTQTIEYQIDEKEMAQQIFKLINKARSDNEIIELTYNDELQSAADIRAKEISEWFSHTRPDNSTCYTAFTMDYSVAGENIIKADNPIATAKNLVDAWMQSQGHKDNILLKDFISTAIGVYVKDDITYAVQLFVG